MSIEAYRSQLKNEHSPVHVMFCLHGGLPRVRCTENERRQLVDETLIRLQEVDPQPVERGDLVASEKIAA